MRVRLGLSLSLALAAFAMTGSARADLYGRSTLNSGSAAVTVHTSNPSSPLGSSLSTRAGSFTTTISTSSSGSPVLSTYETYCVDLFHYTKSSFSKVTENIASSFTAGVNNTGPSAYQLAGLGRAAWLVNTFANMVGVDKAALQIAVWKAEYENKSADFTSLSSGDIYFTGLSSAVSTNAVNYLNASITAGGGTNFASADGLWFSFEKDGKYTQDQIAAVPEPATLAIAGLGFLGFVGHRLARRRRSIDA